ncbi:MAG: efflux RND transporter permease subunit [Minwuia sp.]|nr:efflux RND transporter permease subunit [Minwuia sp.]
MNPAELVRIFVRHPNAANLLMALMLIAGLFSVSKLNTQFFPDTGLDFITVTVVWPGASAEDVDAGIVAAIEPEVRFGDGVKQVNSYSQEGVGVVVVEFKTGTDMQSALSDIDAAVAGITTLPEDTEEPRIKRVVRYDLISRVSISGPISEGALKALAKRVRDGLLDQGIDLVNFFGKRDQEIHVDVPPSTLRRLNLTLADLSRTISDTSVDLPSGDLSGASEKQLRSLGELQRADEIAGIEVASAANGEKIFLRDVSEVRESFDDGQPVGRRNSNPAIELIVQRSQTTDALEAAAIVNSYLNEIRSTLPPNIEIRQYDVQASLISDRINLLLRNGLSGLVLVLIVLFVFLSGRIAFWVAMGIPVAIFATGAVMLWSGQSINMVSLFALIMTLGIIVDDAIVVGEHAAHLRAKGMSAVDAAEAGALRMLAPVTAAALTTIAAFMPLFAIGDVIGQIIGAIPLVVVAVLVASLIECFFVLPGHLRGAMAGEPKSSGGRYHRFRVWFDGRFDQLRQGRFRRMVVRAVDYRYVTIGGIVAALIISIGILASGRVGFVFFPNPESDTIDVNVEMAAGTPRSAMEDALLAMEQALLRAEQRVAGETSNIVVMGFQRLGQSQGRSFERVSGDHLGGIQVELVASDYRNVRTNEFIEIWREEIPQLSGVRRITLQERAGGPPGRELDIRFRGSDIQALKLAAEDVKLELQRYNGLSDIEDDLPYGKQELILELTPRGRALGFTTESVARQVRDAFEGSIAKRFPRDDEEVTIRVQLPESEATEAAARGLYLRSASGAETPLEEVVAFREDAGFARIRRKDGQREVAVFAEVDEAVTKSGVVIDGLSGSTIQAIAQRHNVSYRFAGKAEEQAQTLGDMQTGAMIGLSGIYIILAWVFASYARPIIVMSIIPFGLIGAVTGHLILGYDITILSLVALIGLAGILVNNSIILVSTIDERVKEGQDVMTAIVDGSCDRLRAVTLTSITTIVGLVPLLFETSLQAQFLIPMAVTIVFGLATASVLVLFVVPALLGMLEDIGVQRQRISRWINGARDRGIRPASPEGGG